MTLHTYLPQDRLRALARGETLPDRTNGSALFADISGFTPLTESLRESLGPRRGAEELTNHLNKVYDALIAEVEKFNGSVISFAGDAVTCWFDDAHGQAAPRAVTCALALQGVMSQFSAISLPNNTTIQLTLKIAIATGSARRFVLGDPAIRRIDTLAGATIERMASAERLAQKGELLVDEHTVQVLGTELGVREWREDNNAKERFAVITQYNGNIESEKIPAVSSIPDTKTLREWILSRVYEREVSGQGSFLTEFRPCVTLFVRFDGINYDADEAEVQLDAFIKHVEAVVTRHDGTLLEITVGDKGSYLYINFGGLSAHEDDARRAVKTALELRAEIKTLRVQMGISQGVMYVGAFGGQTRQTYSALGDEVNLAARLMQATEPGEILVSRQIQKTVTNQFTFEPRPLLSLKGKAEPLSAFVVTDQRQQRAIRLQEPTYALPMVGRQAELQTISEKLDLALQGQAQIIGIVAEAGMGKSRLVAEVIRLARRKGFTGYGGACQSDGIQTPYLAWKAIWGAFFGIDPELPLRKQIRSLEGEIEDRTPERVNALPLLGPLLNLAIPDNDFTATLEPKDRKGTLHALVEDCLKAATKDEPLLIVIEDVHWIDSLSNDLLEELARSLSTCPICFVLAYRPPQLQHVQAPQLDSLPHFTKIELSELSSAECEQAIRAKLTQLYPARSGAVPSGLIAKLMARAQGNPFYLEELLNYLRDRGLDPREPAAMEKIELPDSLHTLILSRIDQLTEREKTTLRVASVIGRLFRADWLLGYYPALGNLSQVEADLDELHTLDITPLDTPEPELAYLFKHIVTHEVTYESLPFAMRAQLHELLAQYLESIYPEDPPLDALTFHYNRSENLPKKREYLRKSAEAAYEVYSNEAALEYYEQILALSPEPDELIDIHLKSGIILQVIGKWDDALTRYKEALQVAEKKELAKQILECQIKIGTWKDLRGEYQESMEWLNKAHQLALQLNDSTGICDVLNELCSVYWRTGNYDTALEYSQKSLDLARQINSQKMEAIALFFLGSIHGEKGDYANSLKFFEATLAIARRLKDKRRIGSTLLNMSTTYYYQGNYETAQNYLEDSLGYYREIGDKRGTTIALNNIGNIFFLKNDYQTARKYYMESLGLARELEDRYTMSIALSSLGITSFQQGNYEEADNCYQEGMALSRALDHKVSLALLDCYLGLLALARSQTEAAREFFQDGLTIAHESKIKAYIVYNLIGFACVYLAKDKPALAVTLLGAAIVNAEAIGFKIELELEQPYEQALQTAKERLSGEVFSTAWEAGSKMTFDEAVELALKTGEDK